MTVDLTFDDGLIPAIAHDAESGQVLMFAYASPEAIERTEETGLAHYYSRSREELWQKGATSGHVQHVEAIRVDCDGDALVYEVEQEGGACHTGYESCFYRTVETVERTDASVAVSTTETGEQLFDPEEVYE
ncbi:phosphoribosyl-AMP cyclohydrolase [Halocatena pleomorpha]|uniref:Phosphoribosyl-AMP cyclohydrolase n=1 Tax=Halocatena pleomorpha TaxID=1785090 RepID=A0A3P3R6M5_9EURY|nr:phosphoribosyl-AMP cyclohydrolase [Halocatena pleomorpha]RRJ29111.1 phosphoribosyl-AMP cyclohydrolase [Halocatena pleomorpha]